MQASIFCRLYRSAPRSPVHQLCTSRCMSSSQLASALRPFYFAVHPDLFSGHPEMRRVNEQSLKTLNGYLDTLYRRNAGTVAKQDRIQVQFYIRNKSQRKDRFTPILINLGGESNPRAAILHILESVKLDTKHIPNTPANDTASNVHGHHQHVWNVKFDDEKIRKFWESNFKRKSEEHVTLSAALEKHISQVERLQQTTENMTQHVNKDINRLKSLAGVKNIEWSPLWNIQFCRGALRAFDMLLKSYPQLVGALGRMNNVSIRFDTGSSHLCVNGVLQLGVNDPSEYWMRVIQAGPATMACLRDITVLEKKLSKCMANVKLERDGHLSAVQYHQWLQQLVTRFVLEERDIPDNVQYSGLLLNIYGPTTGLFVSHKGEIILPCTQPVKEIFKFLKEYAPIAKSRQTEFLKKTNEILGASHILKKRFNLDSITYDCSAEMTDILKCFDKIENIQNEELIEKLKNVKKLHIGKQDFGVTHDGKFILPMNFEES